MWAKPPLNLPGKPGKKHVSPGVILCAKCGRSNLVSESAKKAGRVKCKRCGRFIKVTK